MSEKMKIDGKIWEFIDDKLNITNPIEVSQTFDKSDILLSDFQFNGIKKGMEFSEKDYKKLSLELSMVGRTNDVIELEHIYDRQCERDSLLDELYRETHKKIFKLLVDTKDIEGIKWFLKEIYDDEFGYINDDIIEIDAHYIIDKINRYKNRNNIVNTLLDL